MERLKGSPDGKYVLALSPEQYILLDAATGKELGAAPLKGTTTPGGKWTQMYWKGDRIYISQDSWLGSQDQTTYFTGFRLVPAGDKVTWEKFTVDDMSGAPNMSVSDDGRTAVQFGQNQLFAGGKRMRTLPAAMSVLPDGSGLYAAEPKGSLAVFDLEGKQQWVRALPAGFTFGGSWQGGFVAASPAGGWVVLKGKDGTGPSGKTELLALTARYLLVRGAADGLDLVDAAGKVAARLPENAFPGVSDDQQWLWFHSGDEVRAYRLN